MKLRQVLYLEVGAVPQVPLHLALVMDVHPHGAAARPAAPPAGSPPISPSPGPAAYAAL